MSTELAEKVDVILQKTGLPDRHSFFQIEKFMVGKEPTVQAQLWAIARELQARKETVDNFRKDLVDAEDNLELFDIRIERLDRRIKRLAKKEGAYTDLNIKECEINIRKLQREKEALVKAARKVNNKLKCVLEETAHLVAGYDQIVEKFGESKPFDDEHAQKEMWNEKLLEEFNLRLILQRPLDPEFIKTVLCLHDEAPVKKQVVGLIEQVQSKMIANRKPEKPQVLAKAKIMGK